MAAIIFVVEIIPEVIFKHWLALYRQIDGNSGSGGKVHKKGIQGQ